jgi:DNA-directed RNA polymerase specialized sigma24 family protein
MHRAFRAMSDPKPANLSSHPDGGFATTLWTVVLQAGGTGTTQSRAALERLGQLYWFPLYAHARRRGCAPQDAQDAVQGLFAELIERSPFQGLSPDKGRFRSFLLAALDHFLADERDRRNAAKRGGGRVHLSLDEAAAEDHLAIEPAGDASPERDFDRRWALAVLDRALDALEREQAGADKQARFARLRPFLTDTTGNGDYTALARELEMPANSVAVAVRRLRQRYRELVRAGIAETVAHPADVDAEMGHLLAAVRG